MKIGIPRALSYYSYYPMWKTFFEHLGVEVVVSDPTTKKILDDGVTEAVTDACVPIKLFHGHVINLMERVDYIFVPRIVSVDREDTFCPKFLGLPDMVKYSIKGLPELITTRIDLKKGRLELIKVFYRVGSIFTKNIFKVYKAYTAALKSLKEYADGFLQGGIPPLNIRPSHIKGDVCLAVLGYPYILYDSHLSLNLIKKLLSLGASVVTPEMLSPVEKAKQAVKLSKTLFWHYSNEVIRTAFHLFEKGGIDGIIHITAFGCGPDFMVDKLLELEAKDRNLPFLTITLDEHTGEEGLKTRLEAFVDMLRLRRAAV
ncbi:hypothetical protein H0A61_01690 [Koleobacter methoxysyntrophicus]|uniref:DUF2229 domain-containing protein n=1 Tax=Koleobacter methoxysyntrophicus TaxID=2751313 RepID=A0A8A0RPA1_9FIRM|nr:acyl-CoA dehydratase activase-related protein [Koleobacter methoxysyntrophicus]QSQ09329.1 hypothetical protein H0A61_01690 [Koleobacter methoxysyntrophicus]